MHAIYPGQKSLQKSRSYLKIPVVGKIIEINFHIENSKILHATVTKLVAWENWRPEFVHL
jgi:predicted membrane protein